MTITRPAPQPEDAQLILRACYENDRAATYCQDYRAVHGSVLTAVWRPEQRVVEISSNALCRDSLLDWSDPYAA